MKNLGKILFFGRQNCEYSKKIKIILKKNSNKLFYHESKSPREKINKSLLKKKYDYIFCFRSFYILKKDLLKRVKNFTLNFHPGPPKYRGIGSYNFALYNRDKTYGCTAHIIKNNKIDNGPILDCKFFKINKKDNLEKLINKTHKELYLLAVKNINLILNQKFDLNLTLENNKYKWSKKFYKKKDLDKLFKIDLNIKKKQFRKVVLSVDYKNYKPFIILHGKKFIME